MSNGGKKELIGVLVLRAWHTDGQFRARLTATLDIEATQPGEPLYFDDVSEVSLAVLRWLETFDAPSQPPS